MQLQRKSNNMKGLSVKYLIITLLCILCWANAAGQNNVTMESGTLYIDGCQYPAGTIYDNGGYENNYTNNFIGYVVITAHPGVTINLIGRYNTEQCCDKITIYDGCDATGNILFGPAGGNSGLNVSCTTGCMTLKFTTDGSVVRSGFSLSYSCSIGGICNNRPYNLRVNSITDNSVGLSWSASNPSDQFVISVNGTSTTVTGTSHTVTGLSQATTYDMTLCNEADTANPCCNVRRSIRTSCNPIARADLPYRYGFEDATHSSSGYAINGCWTVYADGSSIIYPEAGDVHSGFYSFYTNTNRPDNTIILALPEYLDQLNETMVDFWSHTDVDAMSCVMDVGVMEDPFDTSTFTPVQSITFNNTSYQYNYVSLASYNGPGRFVAMRMSGRVQEVFLDDVTLRLSPHCPDVTGLTVERVNATSMAVSWSQSGGSLATPTSCEVNVIPTGGGTPITTTTLESPIILSGLTPETEYQVSVRYLCAGGHQGNWDTILATTSSLCGPWSSPSGSGYDQVSGVPVHNSFGNTICQTIYSASQLSAMGVMPGAIHAMTYTWTSNRYPKDFSIYIGTTSQSYYPNQNPITSGLTLVYNGIHNANTSGTQTYPFSTPFVWDGVSNLVVTTLMNKTGISGSSTSGFWGHSTQASENVSLYASRNNTPYAIGNLGAINLYPSSAQPNVTFSNCFVHHGCHQPLPVVTDVGITHVTLRWSIDSSSNGWDIAYKRSDNTTWITVATNYPVNEYTFNNLDRGVEYNFRVTAVCDSGTNYIIATAMTLCRNNTFNFDDLYADNVKCYFGTFNLPRQSQGVIDNGSSNSSSRHTVHHDRMETDLRTGNLLHTVPEGYCSSVRLGNWETGGEAESITYTHQIDTNDYNLLLLKYAAVLQNPNHTSSSQPRFTFTITDTNGIELSPCYSADFVSNFSLGWNIAPNNVLWKDWTTIGIDLEPLHGLVINITLTSYDCNQGAHYGYAYFVLDLDNKGMSSTSCSSDENTFRAPSGFAYRWYSATDTTTLSTADTLHVYQAGTYYCNLAYVGAPNDSAHSNCFFTMAAIAGERHPWARFTITYIDTTGCDYVWVRMQNQSIITGDTAHTDSIGSSCESYLWRFDDGTSTTEVNPRHAFTPGTHTVALYAMLANGGCIDTATATFFVHTPCLVLDTVSRTICLGDTLPMFDTLLTTQGTYELDSLLGGDSLLIRTLYLTVLENSSLSVTEYHCNSYLWPQNATTYYQSGTYFDTLPNAVGCDSIITLHLTLSNTFITTRYDTLCQGQTLTFAGQLLATTGQYADTVPGNTLSVCDTIHQLLLTVHPTYHFAISDTICDGSIYPYNGHSYTTTGIYVDTLRTHHMCDSIAHINLFVRDTVMIDTLADACDGYLWYGQYYSQEGQHVHFRPHLLPYECDTAIHLTLSLRHATFGDTVAICCDSFSWYGQRYSTALPTPTHTLTNSVGCDSTVSLHLTVNHSDTIARYDTIYRGDTIQFEGQTYSQPGDYYFSTTNLMGCDSTRILHLVWRYMVTDTLVDTICQGDSYLFAHTLLTEAGIYVDTLFSTHYPIPDTLRFLVLRVMPLPVLTLSSTPFCGEDPHHLLQVEATVPYHRWWSLPEDWALQGHHSDSVVRVNPTDTTVYYVTADYSPVPLCPVTESIQVEPIHTLSAHIDIFPTHLTTDGRILTAYNRSVGQVEEVEWYVRYDNQEVVYYGSDNNITLEVPAYVDSLWLILRASNALCQDTDTLQVPILASSLYIPNVFTPDLETNNIFRAVATGITDFEIWIYDRRGDLVFHSTDINHGWDGTHQGRKCVQAAYAYKCRYIEQANPSGYQSKTGTVLLLR